MTHKHKHATSNKELRLSSFASQGVEIRKAADGLRSIEGYAAVYNSRSEPRPFYEVLKPGCFDRTLNDGGNKLIYFGHDSNRILGSTNAGTLKLSSDSTGLRFTCSLPDTSDGRDAITLLERGDISQMSFGFSLDPDAGDSDRWSESRGTLTREVAGCTLWEVSLVGTPAYSATSVNLKSALRTLPAEFKSRFARDVDDDDVDNDGTCACSCSSCADCTGSDEEEASRNLLTSLLLRRMQ
jgi:HK97 family phage prohead protease